MLQETMTSYHLNVFKKNSCHEIKSDKNSLIAFLNCMVYGVMDYNESGASFILTTANLLRIDR